MVNNGNRDICPVSFRDRIVGKCSEITCCKCKKKYEPSDKEISSRNPNVYFKNCEKCRDKMKIYFKSYIEKQNFK